MGQEILAFGDNEIEKNSFYRHKSTIFLKKDVDIEKVLLSSKISSGEKTYKYVTSAYVKRYDGQTTWMYFLIEDDDLLEKYNTVWDKVSADIKKEFDSEPAYQEKKKQIKWILIILA